MDFDRICVYISTISKKLKQKDAEVKNLTCRIKVLEDKMYKVEHELIKSRPVPTEERTDKNGRV
jgi:hypothetical protein